MIQHGDHERRFAATVPGGWSVSVLSTGVNVELAGMRRPRAVVAAAHGPAAVHGQCPRPRSLRKSQERQANTLATPRVTGCTRASGTVMPSSSGSGTRF